MDSTEPLAVPATRRPLGAWILVAAIAAAVGFSYWSVFPTFFFLFWEDSNYSHGWMIIPISLAILWQRFDRLPGVRLRPRWWGVLPLIALIAVRVLCFELNQVWLDGFLFPIVIAATIFAVGGWGPLRWALPALLFLFFMVPLPVRVNDLLAGPLQRIATLGSVAILESLGQPVLAQGNVILIGTQRVEVAEACRGLSMLLSFGALITAMVILVRRPILERVVLMASIVPIALFCNIIRITATAIVFAKLDRPVHAVHDWAGYAMMAVALGLVLLELKVMSLIFVDEEIRPLSQKPGFQPAYGAATR